jgi:hypothetical protein
MVRATTASAERTSAMLERVYVEFRGLAIATRFASRSRSGGGIVMNGSSGMSTPVTRGEFAQFEMRLEQRLAQLATKGDLEIWGGALLARIESGEQRLFECIESGEQRLFECIESGEQRLFERIESGEQRLLARLFERIESGEQRLLERIDSSEQRLLTELARHTMASSENMSAQISVIDEKYADLPPRVGRLEAKAFRTKRADR